MLYQSTKHRAELKLSRPLLNCTMADLLPDFSPAFPAGSNRRTKERFVNMPTAERYVIITWTETRILKEKTKLTVRVMKFSFRLQAYVR